MVIHEIPLAQLLALSACSAWAKGQEPVNGAYEEWELDRELDAIKSRDRAILDTSLP